MADAAALCAAIVLIATRSVAADLYGPLADHKDPPLQTNRAQAVFDRYQALMPTVKQPLVMVFEYTRTRSGPTRVVTENHRVYRDAAGHERNETIAINGSPIAPPIVSTYARTDWPYSVDKFFVDATAYAVEPKGIDDVNGRKAYAYAVVMKEAGAFAVTDLELDARTALPLREHFTASNDTCAATGSIEFGRSGVYWMPTIVGVTCPVAAETPTATTSLAVAAAATTQATVSPPPAPEQLRDTIRFSAYSFPTAIPPQVFGLPPTPAPAATGLSGP